MTHHNLKCHPRQFNPIREGAMKSTVRYNDRNYQIGDSITFNECEPSINSAEGFQYSCRVISAIISHIDDYGCQHGYVNLSLRDVGLLIADELPEMLKEQA